MIKKVLVIAIYSHPEYYPPNLNALEYLSEEYDHIYVVHRNYKGFNWIYPSNVTLLACGKQVHVRDAEQASAVKKLVAYVQFGRILYQAIKKNKADTVLIYDYMPLLAYRWVSTAMKRPRIIWYHNHDVGDAEQLNKKSISWWAWKTESWIFPKLDIFSLPAMERKGSFPMEKLKGQFFFIPNFPSVKVYAPFQGVKRNNHFVKLLYQGSIGLLHGLEEIIPLLANVIEGRQLQLVLKGFISHEYRGQLTLLAEQYHVSDKLIFKDPGGYYGVIENAAECHIGIGIHKKNDIMNKTLGTASNKIYEYAALGLPVLLFDNAHFRKHLEKYRWAFFTDCTPASLAGCIEAIVKSYDSLSKQASTDFNKSLNFEHYFGPVINRLRKS